MRRFGRPLTMPAPRGSAIMSLSLALVLLLVLAQFKMPPSVQAASGDCITSGATVTCTYTYTGSEQTFTVPANASNIEATAIGAAGGSTNRPGGRGAQVSALLTGVQGGQTLYLEVGGVGTSVG